MADEFAEVVMFVKPIMRRERNPSLGSLSTLIGSIGTEDFKTRFARDLADITNCNSANACFVGSGRRQVLSACGAPASHERTSRFIIEHWHSDPASQKHPCGARSYTDGVLMHFGPADIAALPYRRSLYCARDWADFGSRVIERLDLIKDAEGGRLRLAMFRTKDEGPFRHQDVETAATMAEIFFCIAAKHQALYDPLPRAADQRKQFSEALFTIAPHLSPRETDVCAAIAAGLSSEGIGIDLGISVNTVLTHRKNAYAKLNISSQNQLMRLIFTSNRAAQRWTWSPADSLASPRVPTASMQRINIAVTDRMAIV